MQASDLAAALDAKVYAAPENRKLEGCYIGDLLSRVIGSASADSVWITIMNNLNVPAVALLADVGCIVLAEGVEPMDGVTDKCLDEGIWLLQSGKSAFELAKQLAALGF